MSSSNHTPFEDITNKENQDPNEVKRQRNREYYAKNKDKINSRRRQTRELKKQSLATVNDENTQIANNDPKEVKRQRDRLFSANNTVEVLKRVRQTGELNKQSSVHIQNENILSLPGSTGQSGVTQLQCRTHAAGLNLSQALVLSRNGSQRTPLSNVTNSNINGIGDIGSACSTRNINMDLPTSCFKTTLIADDDSDWLHRDYNYLPPIRSLQNVQNVHTSVGGQEQYSFIARSAHKEDKRQRDSSEETRQRKRERYTLMPDEQRNDTRQQKSRTLLSTAATTLCFHQCSACHNFDFLKGVLHDVLNDLSFRDVVKNAVLIMKDARKPTGRDNSFELPMPKKIKTEDSSVNHIFKYLLDGVCYHTLRAPTD